MIALFDHLCDVPTHLVDLPKWEQNLLHYWPWKKVASITPFSRENVEMKYFYISCRDLALGLKYMLPRLTELTRNSASCPWVTVPDVPGLKAHTSRIPNVPSNWAWLMLESCSKIFTAVGQPSQITLWRGKVLRVTFGDISTFIGLWLLQTSKVWHILHVRMDSGRKIIYKIGV